MNWKCLRYDSENLLLSKGILVSPLISRSRSAGLQSAFSDIDQAVRAMGTYLPSEEVDENGMFLAALRCPDGCY